MVNAELVPDAPALNVASPDSVSVVPVTPPVNVAPAAEMLDENVPVVDVNPAVNDVLSLNVAALLNVAADDAVRPPENVAAPLKMLVLLFVTSPLNVAFWAAVVVPEMVRLATVTLPLKIGVPVFTAAAEIPPLLKTCEKKAIHAGERFFPSLVISVDGTGGKLTACVPARRQRLR